MRKTLTPAVALLAALVCAGALAQSWPGKLNYGTSGPGSISHLAGAMYSHITGVKATEVPYKGGILGVQDLVAGHIQYIFSDSLQAMQFIKAGRARALCVPGAEL